jgi:hypothetical protein
MVGWAAGESVYQGVLAAGAVRAKASEGGRTDGTYGTHGTYGLSGGVMR